MGKPKKRPVLWKGGAGGGGGAGAGAGAGAAAASSMMTQLEFLGFVH